MRVLLHAAMIVSSRKQVIETLLQAVVPEGLEDMTRLQEIFRQAQKAPSQDYLLFKGASTDGGVDEDKFDYW